MDNQLINKSVFISYSHKDKKWLERLQVFLKPLRRTYNIVFWDDTQIQPGTDWRESIRQALEASQMAIFLVSPDFLASDFITQEELPALLGAAEKRGTKILSLILRPCRFEQTPGISKYQAINKPTEPLNMLKQYEQDAYFVELTNAIEFALNKPPISAYPAGLDKRRVLVFDIDGTLLREGEDLSERNARKLLNVFRSLIDHGFYVVFITGNDYNKQKPRVLLPMIQNGLAASITCFSDGGSRVFEYDPGIHDFKEEYDYSRNHIFRESEIAWIETIFQQTLRAFIKENPDLTRPDISLLKQAQKQLDLLIYPIQKTFFRNCSQLVVRRIQEVFRTLEIESDYEILDDQIPNALVVRLIGRYAAIDAYEIQNRLHDLLKLHEEFSEMSLPEIEKRGGADHICQIALKPFKLNTLRTHFMHSLKERFADDLIGEKVIVLLGGKTTIDIQLRHVNKTTAILHLIENKKFDPARMIYFGDEFINHGNDLPVAIMDKKLRPGMIVHVGDLERTPEDLRLLQGLIFDGNGPEGTANYLNFLLNEKEFDN